MNAQSDSGQLHWKKCLGDGWCPFATVVLPDANASGMLVIWSAPSEQAVYIAKGGIAKSLRWARQYEPFLRHGELGVTWANVPEERQDGVLSYLTEVLDPIYRDRPTGAEPTPVNLPWERQK
jgi:hypothetical protein